MWRGWLLDAGVLSSLSHLLISDCFRPSKCALHLQANMMLRNRLQLFYLLFQTSLAATPTCTLKPAYSAPVLSNGWQAQLIVQNLTSPRSVLFDGSGNLLVVQQGAGIVHLEFNDDGMMCLDVAKKTYLVNSTDVSLFLPHIAIRSSLTAFTDS
jgi:glucose/arabinose dehydrogenase